MMLEKIKEVFESAFSIDPDQITSESTIDDVKEWDSMNHLALVIELEKQFSVKFKPNEMEKLGSVQHIIEVLQEKGVA